MQFGRQCRLLQPDHVSAVRTIQQISSIRLYKAPKIPPSEVPTHDPSTPSPTLCHYPEQPLISLLEVLQSNIPQSLYRVRVFVDSYSPDNYPGFRRAFCAACGEYAERDAIRCSSCKTVDLTEELFFKLHVRDFQDGFSADILGYAGNAREFLGVGESAALPLCAVERVEKVVRKWCDLHVFSVDNGGKVGLVLAKCKIADLFI